MFAGTEKNRSDHGHIPEEERFKNDFILDRKNFAPNPNRSTFLRNWTVEFEMPPCDLTDTRLGSNVSEKFKKAAEKFDINCQFIPAKTLIAGVPLEEQRYFVKPLDWVDCVDKINSAGKVAPDNHPQFPGWLTRSDSLKVVIHKGSLKQYHWVKTKYVVGGHWIVSSDFRKHLEDHNIIWPIFFDTIESTSSPQS